MPHPVLGSQSLCSPVSCWPPSPRSLPLGSTGSSAEFPCLCLSPRHLVSHRLLGALVPLVPCDHILCRGGSAEFLCLCPRRPVPDPLLGARVPMPMSAPSCPRPSPGRALVPLVGSRQSGSRPPSCGSACWTGSLSLRPALGSQALSSTVSTWPPSGAKGELSRVVCARAILWLYAAEGRRNIGSGDR